MTRFLREITISNYKSIGQCRVILEDVCILVGQNGAGKSNFLDALRLISEGLQNTLEYAIRQRGGINDVRRRSSGHPRHITMGLKLALPGKRNALFQFSIGAAPNSFTVQHEQVSISSPESLETYGYEVKSGVLHSSSGGVALTSKIVPDRFLLTTVSAVEPFTSLYDALASMEFFSINPSEIRILQPHDSGHRLLRDGANIASVIRRLEEEQPAVSERIREYMRRIIPGLRNINFRSLGPMETLEFQQDIEGSRDPWRFLASSMSDGTLRSLGVLTALFHDTELRTGSAPLIAIEEPESTIHPGAAAVLMEALLEASRKRQIIVTTHSPDLLDYPDLDSDYILAVSNRSGTTRIAPVDDATRSTLKERLLTPGELLRANQLQPQENGEHPRKKPQPLFW